MPRRTTIAGNKFKFAQWSEQMSARRGISAPANIWHFCFTIRTWRTLDERDLGKLLKRKIFVRARAHYVRRVRLKRRHDVCVASSACGYTSSIKVSKIISKNIMTDAFKRRETIARRREGRAPSIWIARFDLARFTLERCTRSTRNRLRRLNAACCLQAAACGCISAPRPNLDANRRDARFAPLHATMTGVRSRRPAAAAAAWKNYRGLCSPANSADLCWTFNVPPPPGARARCSEFFSPLRGYGHILQDAPWTRIIWDLLFYDLYKFPLLAALSGNVYEMQVYTQLSD